MLLSFYGTFCLLCNNYFIISNCATVQSGILEVMT